MLCPPCPHNKYVPSSAGPSQNMQKKSAKRACLAGLPAATDILQWKEMHKILIFVLNMNVLKKLLYKED
jgi:hypothetical protein